MLSSLEAVKICVSYQKDDFLQLLLGNTYWSRSHLKDIIFICFILATMHVFFVKHIVSIIVIYIRAP